MSSTKENNRFSEELKHLVEQAAEAVVTADIGNTAELSELIQMVDRLERQTREVDSQTASVAENTGTFLGQILMGNSTDPEKDFSCAAEGISALQQIICQGVNPQNCSISATLKTGTGQSDLSFPPGVDESIFQAFLEQQYSVLNEIDEHIICFEKDKNEESLTALKRILHTMKGEAGVVGADDISEVCHKLEDYLNTDGDSLQADTLFEAKDWLTTKLNAFTQNKPPPPTSAIIEKLAFAHVAENESSQIEDKQYTEEEAQLISDPDLAKDFINEAQEHFEIADENLLILEGEPENKEAVAAVFRSFHTIKGVAGFIGLHEISELSHVAETLLDKLRKGEISFESNIIDLVFSATDILKAMVHDLSVSLQENKPLQHHEEVTPIIIKISAVLEGKPAEELSVKPLEPRQKEVTEKDLSAADPPKASTSGGTGIQQTMKVDAEKVDLLLDAIGELVIAESIVAEAPEIKEIGSQRLNKNISHLSKITRALQDMAMRMRMVPIESTFRKMARLVRDLAKKAGKQVELTLVGKETELDKSMVEKLGDPLIHMIRNSVDHGIEESPQDRENTGKDKVGQILLKAYHMGGNIHIDITDDGRGLNKDRIIGKAKERGIITSAAKMSDQDIFSLVFEPGFSTASQVTEISGRGVGMDVVKRNIEALRGNILITSTPGKGTTFTLVLPLTTAIIDGMQVRVAGQTYIIPTLSVVESLRPSKEMITTVVTKGEMLSFRGSLLPLYKLTDVFHLGDGIQDPCQGIVIVVEDSGKQAAVLVDELLGQHQTVIKCIGEAIGEIGGVSGASILADGTPGLILDVSGIVKLASN